MQQQRMPGKESQLQKLRKIPSNIARRRRNKAILMSGRNNKDAILSGNSSFGVIEAYKALRTNLLFSLPSDGCKKIAITSSHASEGKSTTCLNLAISFAEMNSKVLVIDCDLRRGGVSKLLEEKKTPGLSNYLAGMSSLDEILVKSKYENLSYISSGKVPPNPIELLSLDRMEEMVKKLEEDYDYIFFDTAPINLVSDPMVVSKYVDGFVLIVLQGSTDKDSISSMLEKISFAGAKVLGFVLNGAVSKNNSKNGKNEYEYGPQNS